MRFSLRVVCLILACTTVTSIGQPSAHADVGAAGRLNLLPGFHGELVYDVPQDRQGSWVNLTVDPQGRLITSDQDGKLYRVTPGPLGSDHSATVVEPIDLDIGMAQGLLCAFDSLYVVVNAPNSGLYRLRDNDGDDRYDQVKLLRKFKGAGEHGPHAVILGPGGKQLYIACGNHTDLVDVDKSAVPQNWDEDLLLPRHWDPTGHAAGKLAPGGWVCRTDPEGIAWDLFSIGFRNQYDLAVSEAGELFTFDADMEYDIGQPWYRPTRICHVTSGSEFGWRSGNGKWPPYYPDSLPAAVDIGPGSPTGICFGTGAKFPAKYQQALFACDWSFGKLYAVHLAPDGASYGGTWEQFASGAPLALTDAIVNPVDGAMYFTVGGRNTQSALYRIVYRGDERTDRATPGPDVGVQLRALRRRLEALHRPGERTAVAEAWPHLAHPDRFIRYAARVAIEHQPVTAWRDKALAERNPAGSIAAIVALARCIVPEQASGDTMSQMLKSLGRVDWPALDPNQKLDLLRAYELTFIRLGRPDEGSRAEAIERITRYYPSDDELLNRELCKILIYLEAPGVARKTLDLFADATTQQQKIHYALCLRTLKTGWTTELRRNYFQWFLDLMAHRGGFSLAGFVQKIRQDAVEQLPEEDQKILADLIQQELVQEPLEDDASPRKFIQHWTVDELLPIVEAGQHGRDFESGRKAFAAAACFKCHRLAGEGGIVGPDLTGVGRRFSIKDLLESLIEPSKVISDQYRATVFVLDNGKTVVGRVGNLSRERLMIVTNMLAPGEFARVNRSSVDQMLPSDVSQMPDNLLDGLSREEILNLIAYLRSGGDLNDPAFQ